VQFLDLYDSKEQRDFAAYLLNNMIPHIENLEYEEIINLLSFIEKNVNADIFKRF
jgi:hypothetical protein